MAKCIILVSPPPMLFKRLESMGQTPVVQRSCYSREAIHFEAWASFTTSLSPFCPFLPFVSREAMGAGQSMDAEVAKKNAEAAATTKVASAEAAKLDAEAVATTQRAAADAAADFRKKAAWWTSAAVGAAVVVGLGVLSADFYRHESPAHIKRRMRSLLLSFKVPGENVPESSMLIKTPQLSLFESFTTKPSEWAACCPRTSLLHENVRVPRCCMRTLVSNTLLGPPTFLPVQRLACSGPRRQVGLRQGERTNNVGESS